MEPTMPNETARVFFLKARAANQAVLFRRGPTKWVQMIVWHLDNDTLEYGQWIKKKIRPQRSDLSPSGKYLVYLVDNFEHMPSRTVISRPPYWGPIAAWEHPDPLFGSGGGLFHDEHRVALNYSGDIRPDERWPVPPTVNLLSQSVEKDYDLWKGHINPVLDCRMERDGWEIVQDAAFVTSETTGLTDRTVPDYWAEHWPESLEPIEPRLWRKTITKSTALFLITFYHSQHRRNINKFYIGKKDQKIALEGITWADIDDRNRIIATKEGKLYASKIFGDGSVDYGNLELVADLNPQKPSRILTPENKKTWD